MIKKFIATDGREFVIDKNNDIEFNGKRISALDLEKAGKGTIIEESDEPAKSVTTKPKEQPKEKPEEERTLAQTANDLIQTILNAPGVIKEGVKRNPVGVISKAALNTAIPNAYTAYREGRYTGIPLGLGLDAVQFLWSPIKTLKLGGKMLGMSNRLVNPVTKSHSIGRNIVRNALHEATVGAGDNIIYEMIGDGLDEREHDPMDYVIGGGLGGIMGALSSPFHVRQQRMNANDYAKWLPETPKDHKQEVKQNIRNAQNDTNSDFETFSNIVNEGHPFTTTKGHQNEARTQRREIEGRMNEYRQTSEANTPLENTTLSDFQDMLGENLYNNNSGNLSQTEKDLVLRNFYDDSVDQLLANSPRLKQSLEEYSEMALGHPRAYLDNRDFVDAFMQNYNLSPNEINDLRKIFAGKTTLTIPSKPGYVRAGVDNRNNNEYSHLFKEYINTRPETNIIHEYNKQWSKAKNHEEVIGDVLDKQGRGGILGHHFPYFELNPEVNPTIIGNNPLKARNIGNAVGRQAIDYLRQPKEDIEQINELIHAIVEDAKRLGIETEDGINKYVLSRLGSKWIKADIIGTSTQKKGEK